MRSRTPILLAIACLLAPVAALGGPDPLEPGGSLGGPDGPDELRRPGWKPPRRTPVRPQGGNCPAGMHIVREDGVPGIQDADEVPYRDEDYVCAANEDPSGLSCSGRGSGVQVRGLAVCACDDGYAGADCETCAPGYGTDRSGNCVPNAPPDPDAPELAGAEDSIEYGSTRTLSATSPLDTSFTWEILEGQGCFFDPASGGCNGTEQGPTAIYQAPTLGDEVELTRIRVTPACCSGGPSTTATLVLFVPESIPVSGYGDSRLQPILKALRQFMRHRCIGSGVVGVSRYGSTLGVWGLGRMNGRAELAPDPACGDDTENPFDAGADLVRHDTPFRLASISKPITAAILRDTVRQAWADAEGVNPATITNDMIENLKAFAPGNPIELFPSELRRMYNREIPFTVAIADDDEFEDSTDGRPNCLGLSTHADVRWPGVTVGHFLGHQTGLQKYPPFEKEHVTANLPGVRGLTTESDYQDEEQKLIDLYDQQTILDAKADLGWGANDGYFLPMATRDEMLEVSAGRCLRHEVGVFHYSNQGVAFWQTMIEQNTAAGRFAAGNGDPDGHAGSALERFFSQKLGVATTASTGIFRDQTAQGLPGYDYRQPRKRYWKNSEASYYWSRWDHKRPACAFDPNDQSCSFSDWIDANPGRTRWDWQLAQVDIQKDGLSYNPGGWALVTEAKPLLKFMAKYWLNGYSGNPTVGESRNNAWNAGTSHSGSWTGTKATAIQFTSDTGGTFMMPPRDQAGNILDDFDNLVNYKCALPNGSEHDLPDGVDIFVAFNNSRDKKCMANGQNKCGAHYGLRDEFLKYGVCRINWATINGANVNIKP